MRQKKKKENSSQFSYMGLFQKRSQNQAETESFMPSRPRSVPTGMVASHWQVLLSFCQINYSKRRKETGASTLDSLLLGEVG